MKFTSYLILALSSFIILNCSGAESLTINKTESPVTIDGSLSDWNTSDTEVMSKDGLNVYAKNDDEFLYLFLDVRSAVRHQQISRAGLIVYIGSSEDTRRDKGIGYPAGTFNLLRETGVYDDFLSDPEWSQSRSNIQLLTELEEELPKRVMIVERIEGSDSYHGFIDIDQLTIDGLEIAKDETSRYTSIEMKIPIDGTSIFDVDSERFWVGFATEPPRFRMQRSDYDASNRQQRGQMGGQRQRQQSASQQESAMRRNLGEFEEFFIFNLQR